MPVSEKQVTNPSSLANNSREPQPPACSAGNWRRMDGCPLHVKQIANGGWKATSQGSRATTCSGQPVANGGLPRRVRQLLGTFFVSVVISSHAIA